MESYENFYVILVIITLLLDYMWCMYKVQRQYKVYIKSTEIPSELTGVMSQKTFERARSYALHKNRYRLVRQTYSFATSLIYVLCHGWTIIWDYTKLMIEVLGFEYDDLIHNGLFLFVANLLSTVGHWPYKLYYHFVLEEKYGFNRRTLRFYFYEKMRGLAIQQTLLVPMVCGVVYNVRSSGTQFFVYAWFAAFLTTCLIALIQPDIIAPMLDTYYPLPEGELRTEIEKLAASVGFPLYNLYVVERSKKSSHSNAYAFGLFRKKIALYDTLIKDYLPKKDNSESDRRNGHEREEQRRVNENEKQKQKQKQRQKQKQTEKKTKERYEIPEILALVSHELGHWKYWHALKKFTLLEVDLLVFCAMFALVLECETLYRIFGFEDAPVMIGVTLISQIICFPLLGLSKIVHLFMSRKHEFEADRYAKSLGRAHSLKSALLKMSADNLGFPVYDTFYIGVSRSHPPLLERIKALDKAE